MDEQKSVPAATFRHQILPLEGSPSETLDLTRSKAKGSRTPIASFEEALCQQLLGRAVGEKEELES